MGFLKKFFGGREQKYVDKTGIYFYVRSEHGAFVKVRADRQHDLNATPNGYTWHKTIVDNKHFSRMKATIHFDKNYTITQQELEGGTFISEEAYEASLTAE